MSADPSGAGAEKKGPFAGKTPEQLTKLLTETAKRLKATDAKCKELAKENEALKAAAAEPTGDGAATGAEEVEQLRSQIAELEAKGAAAEIAAGEATRSAQERLEVAKREAEEANAKREALAKENDALKAAAATGSGADEAASSEEVERLRSQVVELEAKNASIAEAAEKDLEAARAEARDFKKRLESSTKKFAQVGEKKQTEFQAELANLREQLDASAAALAEKESALSAAETRAVALDAQLGEASTVSRRHQSAAEAADARAAAMAEEVAQLKLRSAAQSRDDDDRLEQMYQEMDALRADAEKLERQLNESRRLYSEKEQEALEAGSALEEAKAAAAAAEEKRASTSAAAEDAARSAASRHAEELAEYEARLKEARDRASAASARADQLEATAGGDKARLQALLDTKTAELSRWTKDAEAERERIKHGLVEAKKKLVKAEKLKQAQEEKLRAMQTQLEESKATGAAASDSIAADLRAAQAELARAAEEAAGYKARAIKTLKAKDDEIAQLQDEHHVAGVRERLAELTESNERLSADLAAAHAEADRLRASAAESEEESSARLSETKESYERRVKELEGKLARLREELLETAVAASAAARPASFSEGAKAASSNGMAADALAELQRSAADTAQERDDAIAQVQKREAAYAVERKEFDAFRAMTSAMLEEKDAEIRKLLDDLSAARDAANAEVPRGVAPILVPAKPSAFVGASPGAHVPGDTAAAGADAAPRWRDGDDILGSLGVGTAPGGAGAFGDLAVGGDASATDYDASVGSPTALFSAAAGGVMGSSDLVQLAQLQALRDEEVMTQMAQITELTAEVTRLAEANASLTADVRRMRATEEELGRAEKRAQVAESATHLTYLKHVVLKLLETGEGESLLPVLTQLLQFSPEEAHRAAKAMADAGAPPLPAAAAAVDAMGSATSGVVSMLGSYFQQVQQQSRG